MSHVRISLTSLLAAALNGKSFVRSTAEIEDGEIVKNTTEYTFWETPEEIREWIQEEPGLEVDQ